MAIELIHITAAYSNAVLAAIMPQVSEFAGKLELPVEQPVRIEHVSSFRPDPRAGPEFIGGWLALTNGFEFWYRNGHVTGFAASDAYFLEQEPENVPKYFGTMTLSETESVELARKQIEKLGYQTSFRFITNAPTEKRGGVVFRGNTIPRFEFLWREHPGSPNRITIEIDAADGVCKRLTLTHPDLRRSPPKIDIQPELLEDYQKRMKELEKQPVPNPNAPPILPERTRRTLGEGGGTGP